MSFNYIPQPAPIIYEVGESCVSYGKPYFFEYKGRIINLAMATKFYVDHIPLTSYYFPCALIGGNSYHLSASVSSNEEALAFLRELIAKIENRAASKKFESECCNFL